MKINRSNYEEYFLLYTDNELSAADKQAVDDFIRQNPDLQKEFTMLQQSTFSADDRITFPGKEVLMHEPAGEALIHHENYQEMFILYSDEELTAEEKSAVEKFVYHHPQYQEEFELIQSVKLIPDLALTFPDKNRLYQPQPVQQTKRIFFNWTRVAVAAVVLLFAGVLWLAKPGSDLSKAVVKTEIKSALRFPIETAPDIHVTSPADSVKMPVTAPAVAPEKHVLALNSENAASTKNLASRSLPRAAVKTRLEKDKTSNTGSANTSVARSPSPATNPVKMEDIKTVQPGIPEGTIAARPANPTVSQPESPTKPGVIHTLVQNQAGDETSNIILASNDNEDVLNIAGFPVDKKGSIRGLFRKASRFIDKTTSLRPSKKQGLVIGNIEIGFQ